MKVSDAIRTKRAVRQFEDRPLPDEAVRAVLHAGRRAQSSKNSQPWHFIVVRQRETLQALGQMGAYAGHLAGAPLAVVLASPADNAGWWVGFDIGQCAANMQLAAWEHGIGSCIASIYEPEQASSLLGLPPDLHCRVAISFGYPLPVPNPPQPSASGRRSLDDVVHWEKWKREEKT